MIVYKKKFLIVTYASGRVERHFCNSRAEEQQIMARLAKLSSVKNITSEEARK